MIKDVYFSEWSLNSVSFIESQPCTISFFLIEKECMKKESKNLINFKLSVHIRKNIPKFVWEAKSLCILIES